MWMEQDSGDETCAFGVKNELLENRQAYLIPPAGVSFLAPILVRSAFGSADLLGGADK